MMYIESNAFFVMTLIFQDNTKKQASEEIRPNMQQLWHSKHIFYLIVLFSVDIMTTSLEHCMHCTNFISFHGEYIYL